MKNLSLEDFKSNIASDKNIVLVDFVASWCGPCKILGPIVDAVSKELDNVTVIKVDVDSNSDIASEYGIRNIPTVIFFSDGEVFEKFVGVKSKNDIIEIIKKKSIELTETEKNSDESKN